MGDSRYIVSWHQQGGIRTGTSMGTGRHSDAVGKDDEKGFNQRGQAERFARSLARRDNITRVHFEDFTSDPLGKLTVIKDHNYNKYREGNE